MTYELALALKNAGYIQPEDHEGEGWVLVGNQKLGETENVYAPTLEELIEACGRHFGSVSSEEYENEEGTLGWIATSFPDNLAEQGETPTEAVARLWLALNK